MNAIPHSVLAAAVAEVLAGNRDLGNDDGLTTDGWKEVLGRVQHEGRPQWSKSRTIEWLADRLEDGTLKEGRRDAITRIGGKKFKQLVFYLAPEKPNGKAKRRASTSRRGAAR